jgi:hypothetical protein
MADVLGSGEATLTLEADGGSVGVWFGRSISHLHLKAFGYGFEGKPINGYNVIETTLRIGSKVASIMCSEIANLLGFVAEIYFPVENESIYGSSDNSTVYADTPNLRGRFLFKGIVVNRLEGDSTLDNYTGESPELFLDRSVQVPDNSKVIVQLRTDYEYQYRVDRHEGFEGVDEEIYQKLMLVPMEDYRTEHYHDVEPVDLG